MSERAHAANPTTLDERKLIQYMSGSITMEPFPDHETMQQLVSPLSKDGMLAIAVVRSGDEIQHVQIQKDPLRGMETSPVVDNEFPFIGEKIKFFSYLPN